MKLEISDEQFKELAEANGYAKKEPKFEYPMYMESTHTQQVIKFVDIREGFLLIDTQGGRINSNYIYRHWTAHTDAGEWKPWNPHAELKKQYAEDAKTMDEPWQLWEYKWPGGSWVMNRWSPEWSPEATYRRKGVEPETYDGLTEYQWKQVKSEGLLCKFWNGDEGDARIYSLLGLKLSKVYKYACEDDVFLYCRVHRSQPQFVIDGKKPDWLDDDTQVLIYDLRGIRIARSVNWAKIKRFQVVAL